MIEANKELRDAVMAENKRIREQVTLSLSNVFLLFKTIFEASKNRIARLSILLQRISTEKMYLTYL